MMKFRIDKSKALNGKLKQFVPGGVHYSFRMPWESKQIHFTRGDGSRAWDVDGNEYLDLFGKFGANILGHNHPRYNAELMAGLGRISSANLSLDEGEAAELICEHIQSAEMLRFSLSGTEAVQNALRLARAATGKQRFIRFQTHYHGNADNLIGGLPGALSFPVPVEANNDFYDTEGKANGICQEQSFLLPWNDLTALESTLSAFGGEVAALLMEPICINGGGILPQRGYLEGVRGLCDRHGVVLIFDEVITGFRVGLGGAQALLGVVPDLTILGKALSGGALPVSAVAGKREIMKLYADRRVAHGGTFNGYPLGMTAVRATLSILGENSGRALEEMATRMRRLKAVFLVAAERHSLQLDMAETDAAAIFHPRDDAVTSHSPKARKVLQYLPKLVSEAMAEHGILLSNMNRFYGSIALNDDDIALFEERIDTALSAVSAYVEKVLG
jgi:glutamate-1-semialdehyde 2,1-aminomutase